MRRWTRRAERWAQDRAPARGGAPAVAGAVAVALLGLGTLGCSSSSDGGSPAPKSTTTTTRPLVWSATATGEHEVDGNFRQGIARSGDGWIVTTNATIYRTDDEFTEVDAYHDAIPAELAAQGYNHLGDPDVHDGLIWVPVEREDKTSGTQVTARFDEETLEFVDSFEVAQHHNSFVAVDDDGTAWSTDLFSDDTLVRYTVDDSGTVEPADPLPMSTTVENIQGADIADGAIWLSTDDATNGIYRVDLVTGKVQNVGSLGRVDGEGEGIDATDLPSGLLHGMVVDAAIVPVWVVDLAVSSKPA